MNIAFSSYDELRSLHLTICEAKFHDAPYRKDVQASPFVAETANKVFDLLIDTAPSEAKAEEWRSHRVLDPNYRIFPVVKKRCEERFSRDELSDNEKRQFINDMAAPYFVSETLAKSLLGCA